MPDISMCGNNQCPLRYRCYRFTAKPDYYQAYMQFEPSCNGVGEYECEAYIPTQGENEPRRKNAAGIRGRPKTGPAT